MLSPDARDRRRRLRDRALVHAATARVEIGTPGFMAPEAYAGGAITARTDVYGLAASAWALIAGRAAAARRAGPAPGRDAAADRGAARRARVDPRERTPSMAAFAEALGGRVARRRARHGGRRSTSTRRAGRCCSRSCAPRPACSTRPRPRSRWCARAAAALLRGLGRGRRRRSSAASSTAGRGDRRPRGARPARAATGRRRAQRPGLGRRLRGAHRLRAEHDDGRAADRPRGGSAGALTLLDRRDGRPLRHRRPRARAAVRRARARRR